MAGPKNQSLKIDDFDDELFEGDEASSNIDDDFEMLSEEELNTLFNDSELNDSDESLLGNKNAEQSKRNSADMALPDHLKDFDFGDDEFDDF